RADLQLIPKESLQAGVVMELKVVQKSQALLEGVVHALQQLEAKHYETLLESQQVSTLHRYGLAFNGKEVRVAELAQRAELEQALARARAQAPEKAARHKRQSLPAASKTSALSLEERLDLEDLVLPELNQEGVLELWLQLGFGEGELMVGSLRLQWTQLVNRSMALGQLPSLGLLLARQLPALKDQALIQKLRRTTS
ncbi:MAG: PD-(D/E)XK nuclease domain-containing protein, partial [Myxococcota bacterium]